MFSYSLLVIHVAELKYDRTLATRGGWATTFQTSEKLNLQYFQPDRLTGISFVTAVLWLRQLWIYISWSVWLSYQKPLELPLVKTQSTPCPGYQFPHLFEYLIVGSQ